MTKRPPPAACGAAAAAAAGGRGSGGPGGGRLARWRVAPSGSVLAGGDGAGSIRGGPESDAPHPAHRRGYVYVLDDT